MSKDKLYLNIGIVYQPLELMAVYNNAFIKLYNQTSGILDILLEINGLVLFKVVVVSLHMAVLNEETLILYLILPTLL